MSSPASSRTMGREKAEGIRIRRDILDLQEDYDSGDAAAKVPMEQLLWAWYNIQRLDPSDPNSFFRIAGYHGMPFRGAGWGNPGWWGGYCNHGNVLFPTWHRAYLARIENALRSIDGCEDVSLPYWNETSQTSKAYGIPTIFLRKTVTISKAVTGNSEDLTIDNPLRSYKFQKGVWDNLSPIPDANYSKPQGYETKRYPYSGLVGSDDIGTTEQHNKLIDLIPKTDDLLNDNVTNWLGKSITIDTGKVVQTNTAYKYAQCLEAPSYTVFSNTTSATQYNEDMFYNSEGADADTASKSSNIPVVPLESPHNDMHLAVGGFSIPGQGDFDQIIGANGDMGENDTAGFDPIFFFHHCFVDKTFWDWQRKWDSKLKSTKQLSIEVGYPGTNSVDSQGPTPGVAGNVWLNMDSPLAPFTKDDSVDGVPLTSNDVVDIVNQLGYKYYEDDGDESAAPKKSSAAPALELPREAPINVVRVSGINRAAISGSFTLVVRAEINGQDTVIGTESVLSRWKVSGCANCQNHLGVKAFVPLIGLDEKGMSTVRVGLQGRGKSTDNLNNTHHISGGWRLGKMDTGSKV